jgi:hypothetical protein
MTVSLAAHDFAAPFLAGYTSTTTTDTRALVARMQAALPAPLSHQLPVIRHPARNKLHRAGRRTGKSRCALYCAVNGHGPVGDHDGTGILRPLHKGLVHGLDVVWIAPDYPQSRIIWREDVRPKFRNMEGATLNESERTVTFDGLGTLHVRSAEVIDGVRGMGARLAGVIVDEGAYLDLEYALRDVLRPALTDNRGWLLVPSTTNAGGDGNAEKRVPSFFNLLCEEVRAGERGEEWAEFYGTAYDNSALSREAVDELVAEYADGTPQLRQEVYAELLRGGVGVALEELSEASHMVPRFRVPDHWTQFSAFDWGYNHPYAFGWLAVDPDGNAYLVDTVHGRKEYPTDIAAKVKACVPAAALGTVIAGTDCFSEVRARGESGPTIAEQFWTAGIMLVPANTARVMGLNNLRHYVAYKTTGPDKTPGTPRFRLMDTEGNRRVLKVLESMQIDPKNIEDAEKRDAGANGEGGDDAYDMVRYALMSRPITPARADVPKPKDRHPGHDLRTGERKRGPSVREQIMAGEARKPAHTMPRNAFRMPRGR